MMPSPRQLPSDAPAPRAARNALAEFLEQADGLNGDHRLIAKV